MKPGYEWIKLDDFKLDFCRGYPRHHGLELNLMVHVISTCSTRDLHVIYTCFTRVVSELIWLVQSLFWVIGPRLNKHMIGAKPK